MIWRTARVLAIATAALFAVVTIASADPQATAAGDIVPGQFIVVLNEGSDPAAVAADHAAVPLHVYAVAGRGFTAKLSADKVNALLADPRVNNVVPDRRVSALCHKPQHFCNSGGGGGSQQVVPAGVVRVGANQVWGTVTGSGVGVAVIDTGVDFNHGDLSVAASCFTAFTSCQDDHGHGTHVAGIIAARDNSQDVVGVAPGATILSVKVLDQSGNGSWGTVMAGVDWVTTNASSLGIEVANMSLGGSGSDSANCGDPDNDGTIDDPLHKAICDSVNAAAVTYVVAAGNDAGKEVSQMVPAAYPEVMAIASTTALDGSNACKFFNGSIKADTASYFTTDGAGVSVSAPGEEKEDINRGCFISSLGILSTKLGGGTTRMSGTSMAAPHVAGVVALMLQSDTTLSPAAVRSKIESSADKAGTAPLNSPTSSYTFDGEREGIVSAPGALGP